MSNGNQEFDGSFLRQMPQAQLADKLLHGKDIVDFLTASDVLDGGEAADFATIFAKCDKFNMTEQRKKYEYLLLLKCAISGKRAIMFQQTLSGISESYRDVVQAIKEQKSPKNPTDSNV